MSSFANDRMGSVDQALALGTPAIASSHIGGRAGFIQEHKRGWVHEALPHPPALTMIGNVRPILLGGPQRLFLWDRPNRLRVDQIVESEPGWIPRSTSSALISASVMPFRVDISSRNKAS